MTTLGQALATASHYWASNDRSTSRRSGGGSNMMPIRAERCVAFLGGSSRRLSTLTPEDGTTLLTKLAKSGLSRASVASYYSAGRRMLSLSGVSTALWPKPPKVPRQIRPPVCLDEVAQLVDELEARGWPETAELVMFLRDTGLRVEVEALSGPLSRDARRPGLLNVEAGKGGHQRLVPYKGECPPEAHEERFAGLTYEGHLRRINEACKALGVSIKPHDLRRAYALRAYEANGKDLRIAQVLLGHADPGTTAGYIGVDYDAVN